MPSENRTLEYLRHESPQMLLARTMFGEARADQTTMEDVGWIVAIRVRANIGSYGTTYSDQILAKNQFNTFDPVTGGISANDPNTIGNYNTVMDPANSGDADKFAQAYQIAGHILSSPEIPRKYQNLDSFQVRDTFVINGESYQGQRLPSDTAHYFFDLSPVDNALWPRWIREWTRENRAIQP